MEGILCAGLPLRMGEGGSSMASTSEWLEARSVRALEARSAAFRGLRVGRSAVGQSRTFRDAALGETVSAVREETE